MSATQVKMANAALALLGHITIDSFEEGSDLASLCASIQPDTLRGLLTTYPWRFTLAKVQLARDVTAPEGEWTYAHAMPARFLLARELFPSNALNAEPVQSYEIFGRRIYSHQPELWLDYQREIDPGDYPPIFWNLAKHAVAADLAVPVTGSGTMARELHQRAFGTPGEGGHGGLAQQARTLDAQQQPPQRIRRFPLVDARMGWRR